MICIHNNNIKDKGGGEKRKVKEGLLEPNKTGWEGGGVKGKNKSEKRKGEKRWKRKVYIKKNKKVFPKTKQS